MTPAGAADRARAWRESPPIPAADAAWRVLLLRTLAEAEAALTRKDRFSVRDQALLALAHALTRAGAHAYWVLAQAQAPGVTQARLLAVARWHHDLHTAIHAGWERRTVLGSHRAWPLEANQTAPTPLPVQTTELAQSWIERLRGDPLTLPADQAQQALRAIPGGVWIAPPS